MTKPKSSKKADDRRKRNEKILMEYKGQRRVYPDSTIPDCIRGLSDKFDLCEIQIRRILRKAGEEV